MKYSLIILLVLTIILSLKTISSNSSRGELNTTKISINKQEFFLEIAQTTPQKTKGLSGRDSLCDSCGMIFIYNTEAIYPFWMKNTLIPLDIIWINKDGQVIDIIQGKVKDLTILTPRAKSQYIIELKANTAKNLNLNIGDYIKIPQNI